MTRLSADDLPDEEFESAAAAGPTRLRRGHKTTTATRSRKRRKTIASPGGIHRRANKRMTW